MKTRQRSKIDLTLALAILFVMLTACGGGTGTPSSFPTPQTPTTETQTSQSGDIPDTQTFVAYTSALGGYTLGFGVAQMLVTILTGIFDPPPDLLTVPWVYLILLTVAAIVSMVVAVVGTCVASQRAIVENLRNLS